MEKIPCSPRADFRKAKSVDSSPRKSEIELSPALDWKAGSPASGRLHEASRETGHWPVEWLASSYPLRTLEPRPCLHHLATGNAIRIEFSRGIITVNVIDWRETRLRTAGCVSILAKCHRKNIRLPLCDPPSISRGVSFIHPEEPVACAQDGYRLHSGQSTL